MHFLKWYGGPTAFSIFLFLMKSCTTEDPFSKKKKNYIKLHAFTSTCPVRGGERGRTEPGLVQQRHRTKKSWADQPNGPYNGEILVWTRSKWARTNLQAYAWWITYNRELVMYEGYRGVLCTVGFGMVYLDPIQIIIRRYNGKQSSNLRRPVTLEDQSAHLSETSIYCPGLLYHSYGGKRNCDPCRYALP